MTKYQDLFHQNMIFILQYRYLQNDTQGASSCLRGHRRMLISEVTAMLSNCPPFCDFRPLLYCSTAATPLRNYAVVSRWIRNIDANPYWFHLELLSSWTFFPYGHKIIFTLCDIVTSVLLQIMALLLLYKNKFWNIGFFILWNRRFFKML